MRRRPYVRLDPSHPDFGVEDLPHWWQRGIVHAVWLTVVVGGLIAVSLATQGWGRYLTDFLAWLTGALGFA